MKKTSRYGIPGNGLSKFCIGPDSISNTREEERYEGWRRERREVKRDVERER
jgi:hypothetical protein